MRIKVLIAAVLVSAGSVSLVLAAELAGRPRIISGDTLVLAGQRLHLHGVDAPEPGQKCRLGNGKPYDCGLVSRTALMDLTAGIPISCRMRPERTGGETVAACFADGYDLSHGMAHTGWALADPDTGARYQPVQESARKAGRGLWRGAFVAPWDWRSGARLQPYSDRKD